MEELNDANPNNKSSPNVYYAISKLANLLHTLAINKRIEEEKLNLKIVAIRPGFIRGTSKFLLQFINKSFIFGSWT